MGFGRGKSTGRSRVGVMGAIQLKLFGGTHKLVRALSIGRTRKGLLNG